MSPRADRRPDHDAVLAAAVSIARSEGLRAVSLRAAADRLRVPPRLLPGFPDDGALIAAAFGSISAAELAEIKRSVLAVPSPTGQLDVLLRAFTAQPTEVDAVWLEAWSLGRTDTGLAARVCEEQARWHEFVAAVVRRGVRSGDFPDVDADEVAAQLLAVMDGVNAYALVGYRSEPERYRVVAAVARAELGVTLA